MNIEHFGTKDVIYILHAGECSPYFAGFLGYISLLNVTVGVSDLYNIVLTFSSASELSLPSVSPYSIHEKNE